MILTDHILLALIHVCLKRQCYQILFVFEIKCGVLYITDTHDWHEEETYAEDNDNNNKKMQETKMRKLTLT